MKRTRDQRSGNAPKGKASLAEEAFREGLIACSDRDFFGSATLTIKAQGGAIQHVSIAIERSLR